MYSPRREFIWNTLVYFHGDLNMDLLKCDFSMPLLFIFCSEIKLWYLYTHFNRMEFILSFDLIV